MPPLLVRLPNHLGDVCMCLPALEHLAANGFTLTVAGRPWAAPLLAAYPFEVVALRGGLREQARALRRARRGRVLRALLFTNSFSSALACRLAGLRATGYATDARRLLLHEVVPVPVRWRLDGPQPMHLVEYYFALARRITNDDAAVPGDLALRVAPAARERARRMLGDAGVSGPFVMLCPVAVGLHKGKVKAWPGFGRLAERLRGEGWQVVACPGPGERDAVLRATPTVTLLPETDVGTFAALLAGSRLVVANDSGAGHLAAAVGAPLVSVFGVTDPSRTRPWTKTLRLVGGADGWPEFDAVWCAVREQLAAERAIVE
jgi:heptosyltransferase-2